MSIPIIKGGSTRTLVASNGTISLYLQKEYATLYSIYFSSCRKPWFYITIHSMPRNINATLITSNTSCTMCKLTCSFSCLRAALPRLFNAADVQRWLQAKHHVEGVNWPVPSPVGGQICQVCSTEQMCNVDYKQHIRRCKLTCSFSCSRAALPRLFNAADVQRWL
jgi:hypothetical protein